MDDSTIKKSKMDKRRVTLTPVFQQQPHHHQQQHTAALPPQRADDTTDSSSDDQVPYNVPYRKIAKKKQLPTGTTTTTVATAGTTKSVDETTKTATTIVATTAAATVASPTAKISPFSAAAEEEGEGKVSAQQNSSCQNNIIDTEQIVIDLLDDSSSKESDSSVSFGKNNDKNDSKVDNGSKKGLHETATFAVNETSRSIQMQQQFASSLLPPTSAAEKPTSNNNNNATIDNDEKISPKGNDEIIDNSREYTKDSDEGKDDNDDENDETDQQEDIPPSIQQLSCLCWSCHEILKFRNQMFCHYAMHVHPLLGVPICSYCAEAVAGLPSPDTQDESQLMLEQDVEGWCHGCAEMDPGTLLLCDTCPRSFCLQCVAQAHGGGVAGMKRAQEAATEDDDTALWQCPFCQPPAPLQQLQKELDESNNGDTATVGTSAMSQQQQQQQGQADHRTTDKIINDLIRELDCVEAKKKACEAWDSPEQMASKRDEFQQELAAANPHATKEELENLVETEVQNWIKVFTEHDERLGDMAASLQEELQALGVDLSRCYDRCLGMGMDEEEAEPSWKQDADRAVDKLHKENKNPQNPSDPSVYRLEFTENAIDLCTRETDCDPDSYPHSYDAGGWRQTGIRPTEEDVDEAERCEKEMRERKHIKINIQECVDELHDKETEQEEELKISQRGTGGVSRIRRDKWVAALQGRQKRKSRPANVHYSTNTNNSGVFASSKNDNEQMFASPSIKAKKRPFTATSPKNPFDLTSDDSPIFPKKRSIPLSSLDRGAEKTFANSNLILSLPSYHNRKTKKIAVAVELEKLLKPHQKEGIQFIWKNAFADLDIRNTREEKIPEDIDIGGCIVAHCMGLGKSFTTVRIQFTFWCDLQWQF